MIALAILLAVAALPRTRPLEQHPGLTVTAGTVEGPRGLRIRSLVTAPPGEGKLPAIFVTGWLSCNSVELGASPNGVDRLLRDVIRTSGALVYRIDKPGVGDSEGDCAKTDFTTELEAYRAAWADFRRDPRVDPARIALFGISNGGGFSPLIASDAKLYVSVDGWSKTWFEHMIDLERRRVAFTGGSMALFKQLEEFHAAYLFDRLTPAQVAQRRPHLAGVWYDEPESQYGRPAAFYHQLQDLDLAGAWSRVHAPALVVWGEYDWIMDRADQEQIVRLAGPKARLLVVPRADHSFTQHPDAAAAFHRMGEGTYPAEAAREILAFLRQL